MLRSFPTCIAAICCSAVLAASGNTGSEPPGDAAAWIARFGMRFHASQDGRTFHVNNEAHRLMATISDGGMRIEGPWPAPFWEVDLRLSTIGREDGGYRTFGALAPQAAGNELLWTGDGMAVQYLNGPEGIRQNFLLDHRPAGQGPLRVTVALSGDLDSCEPAPGIIAFTDPFGHERLRFGGLCVWDACGTPLAARMYLERERTTRLVLEVDDAEADYPITIDPVASSPTVTILGTQSNGEYGYAVGTAGDLNGDGYSDLVIGAPQMNMGLANEGLAFVYHGSPTGISTTPAVVLRGNQAGAQFGFSVAHAGDLNGDGYSDLAIGSPTYESTATQDNEGGVFVFHGSATGVGVNPDIILQPNSSLKYMGYDADGLGDINGDGFGDLIAGGWLASYGQGNEGAAWVFLGSAAGLSNTPAHRLERNQGGAQFARSVSGPGDINGDGFDDVIVGAYRFDMFQTDDGALFVYFGAPGAQPLGPGSAAQPLNPTPAQAFNSAGTGSTRFAWSVAGAGDVNGDGFSDVITGDWRDNIGGPANEGTAFVFHGSATGLVTTPATIVQSDLPDAWLGRSVSTAGDVNGDGYADVLIGAVIATVTLDLQGAAYLHLGGPSGIPSNHFLRYLGPVAGANMGESVGVAGDLNGDGYTDIVVGMKIHLVWGAMDVYHGGTYGITPAPAMNAPLPLEAYAGQANAHAGWSVAHAGDVNGDGFSDVLVGLPDAANGQAGEGLVHLFLGGAGGIGAVPSQVLEVNIPGAAFGTSVCTAGDVNGDGYSDVVVGAPASGGTGRAYLFHGGPGGLAPVPAVVLTGTPASLFGHAVSTAGDVNADGYGDVVVGAPGAEEAHVHLGAATGLDPMVHVLLTTPQPGSGFGTSVATAGDVNGTGYSDVIVGAPLYTDGQVDEGAAFVFLGGIGGLDPAIATTLERNNAGANMGISVAGAGDVNGDGFHDVVVGANLFTQGQANEGAAHIFFGSPAGIATTGVLTLQPNIVGARFGTSVAEGGDVNGDGYADVVVGAPFISAGITEQGRIHLYTGSPTGVNPVETQLSGKLQARMGWAVAGGGDVDGDGYSDIVAGMPYTTFGAIEEGGFMLYRGNRARSLTRRTRQYRADLVSPLATNTTDFAHAGLFGIGHHAKSHMQRKPGRLVWEVVHEGEPFNGNPITNAIWGTGVQSTWTDLGLTGVELKQLIVKFPLRVRYKWRCRVEYPILRSIDGQRFSRWFYGYVTGHGDIGILPVELLAFQGTALPEGNHLAWTTASEQGVAQYTVERSTDLVRFEAIGALQAHGAPGQVSDYTLLDRTAPSGTSYYRLRVHEHGGTVSSSHTIAVARPGSQPTLHPNPAEDVFFLSGSLDVVRIELFDGSGRMVWQQAVAPAEQQRIPIAQLSDGTYLCVGVDAGGGTVLRQRFVKAQAPMVR